jgi:signal transduction histidine kinase
MNSLPHDELIPAFRDGMILTSYVGLDILVAIFTATAIKINLKKNQELNNSKYLTENLIRILCHDIKNPLSVIQISTRYLYPSQPNTPKWVDRINQAATDIQRIADSVNSWISHRDGKVDLRNEIISVQDISEHISMAFEDKLREKNLTLKLNLHCDNVFIWGDRTAVFFQVFNNLVSNAIKFSYDNSQIDVNFKADACNVRVEVRDYGVGIHDELIDKVFSPFIVTSLPGTHNEKGTGFGLTIVSTIVEKMEGKIKIENMNKHHGQKGTRVEVVFPKLT